MYRRFLAFEGIGGDGGPGGELENLLHSRVVRTAVEVAANVSTHHPETASLV